MFWKTLTAGAFAFTAMLVNAGPVLADFYCGPLGPACLPAPGVFSLVAMGIAGAIAVAKLRK